MSQSNATVGQGLFLIFIAQIVGLFSFIPLLGAIASIASVVISVLGFYTLSKVNADYKNAFTLTIVNLVLSVLAVIFSSGFMSGLISILSTAVSFLIVYLVCNTTAGLLQGLDNALVDRAALIWKLNFICAVVAIVCTLVSAIPLINIIAAILSVIAAIVQLVAAILYLIFLCMDIHG